MNTLAEKIYAISPVLVQELLVSFYNYKAYKGRYGGKYSAYITCLKKNNGLQLDELKALQTNRLEKLLEYAKGNSLFYKTLYANIDLGSIKSSADLHHLPIVDKEMLRSNITEVYTIPKELGGISKTGGTTGKALEVVYTYTNTQERFAMLDNFRNGFGYTLGKRTAWFSGKNLLNERDIKKNRFWKTDHWYKVRYYSTFHIHQNYLGHYLKNIIKYCPEYLVGFPSTMYEIAKYGMEHQLEFPANVVKAIFPTAETITDDIRYVLETYFKTNLYNQYASSEGAPFIFECKNKNLHLELQSGVFEVLDQQDKPTNKGRLVVTAFATFGTPLIRYDIGDEIELSSEQCNCGNNNPLVKAILGRVSDYIYSEETGKINLGNISNCLKGVKGIKKFQIQQKTKEAIHVLIEKDDSVFEEKYESFFLQNLRDRLGNKMNINLEYVTEIPVETSGKFRLVKNELSIDSF